jgi:hypothetical protein
VLEIVRPADGSRLVVSLPIWPTLIRLAEGERPVSYPSARKPRERTHLAFSGPWVDVSIVARSLRRAGLEGAAPVQHVTAIRTSSSKRRFGGGGGS